MTHTNIAAFLNGPVPTVDEWKHNFLFKNPRGIFGDGQEESLLAVVKRINPADPLVQRYIEVSRELQGVAPSVRRTSWLDKVRFGFSRVNRSFNLV